MREKKICVLILAQFTLAYPFSHKWHLHSYVWLLSFNVCIDYIFLIQSSAVGHLGYFTNLDVVNSTVINITVQVSPPSANLYYFG